MRGALTKETAVIFLLMVITLIAVWGMFPDVQAMNIREMFSLEEEELATREETLEESSTVTRFSELEEARKIIEADPNNFYVSEIACDIANDIYNDFSRYGVTREEYMDVVGFGELGSVKCEYATDLDDYVCLVGEGNFTLETGTTLDEDKRENLYFYGCCDDQYSSTSKYCGCTEDTGDPYSEYWIDETCVNEVLNRKGYPDPHDDPFCTDGEDDWLRLPERVKFGNNICNKSSLNNLRGLSVEGRDWNALETCGSYFCDVEGDNLEAYQSDTIIGFWSDDMSDEFMVNDLFLWKNDIFGYSSTHFEVKPGYHYFYNVLWLNKQKRYAIVFTRIPHQEDINREFDTPEDMADFIDDFFFNVNDARKNIGGRYWTDPATVYDGIVNLLQETTIGDLKSLLESRLDVYVDDTECDGEYCLNYPIGLEVWGEWLQDYDQKQEPSPGETHADETPIIIRKSDVISGDSISAGKYRLVIRNWYSGLFYDDSIKEGCPGKVPYLLVGGCNPFASDEWCWNPNIRDPGKKIFHAKVDFCDNLGPNYLLRSCCSDLYHYTIKRYVDKVIILIPET